MRKNRDHQTLSKRQTGLWNGASTGADVRVSGHSPACDARPRKTATQTVPDPLEPGRPSEGPAGSHAPARTQAALRTGRGDSLQVREGPCGQTGGMPSRRRRSARRPHSRQKPEEGGAFHGDPNPSWICEHGNSSSAAFQTRQCVPEGRTASGTSGKRARGGGRRTRRGGGEQRMSEGGGCRPPPALGSGRRSSGVCGGSETTAAVPCRESRRGQSCWEGPGREDTSPDHWGHGKGRGVGHGRDFRVSPGPGDKSGSRSGCAWLLAVEPVGFGTRTSFRGWGKGHRPPRRCAIQNGLKPPSPDRHPLPGSHTLKWQQNVRDVATPREDHARGTCSKMHR